MSLTEYWRVVFGAILAAVVIFFPHGLMGLLATGAGARGPVRRRRLGRRVRVPDPGAVP